MTIKINETQVSIIGDDGETIILEKKELEKRKVKLAKASKEVDDILMVFE